VFASGPPSAKLYPWLKPLVAPLLITPRVDKCVRRVSTVFDPESKVVVDFA